MRKTKSMYDWTSQYRKQLLNRAVKYNKSSTLSSLAATQRVRYDVEHSVSSSYHDTDQCNWNRMHCEQEGNNNYDELCLHGDNDITPDCPVALDLSAISNESYYDKYLLVHDLCEKCSLCVCFLHCGECFHNENYCQHCAKCNEKDYDNDYDESDNFDKEFNIHCETISFEDKLAQWALDTKINHHQLRSLLTILNSECPDKKLRKDSRTLMKTSLKLIVLRSVPPGQYCHNGLAKQLRILYNDTNVTELKLTFNIDGVPISLSSSSTLWPILCSVEGSSNVFPVGIYHGYSKPECSNIFLTEFVDELKDLCQNGLLIDNRSIVVKIGFFCCDTMVAPDATEEDIITGIKEFLRQSIGRAKTWEAKQQNERNPDLHEHMSETEEASILNESGEQSEASSTDVEDDSNKHLPDINKKRVSYVKDSDDDSS